MGREGAIPAAVGVALCGQRRNSVHRANTSLFLELARLEADDRDAASYHGRGDEEEHEPKPDVVSADDGAPAEAAKDEHGSDVPKDKAHPEAVPKAEGAPQDAGPQDAGPQPDAAPEKSEAPEAEKPAETPEEQTGSD